MFCPKCGMQNAEMNVICANCGAPISQEPQQPPQAADGSAPQNPNPNIQQPNAGFQQPPNFGQPPSFGQPNPNFNQPPYPGYGQPPFGQPPFQQGPPINGTPYLVWAIIITVLCCWPLGIPAIVYAAKINNLMLMGDYFGAQEAAKKSKMFTIISASVCLVFVAIYFIFIFFAMRSGSLTNMFPGLN